MIILIFLFVLGTVSFISLAVFSFLAEHLRKWKEKKEKEIEQQLDKLFNEKNPKRLVKLYFILPIFFAILGYLFMKSISVVFLGIILGLFIPRFIIKIEEKKRKVKFSKQILDTIMLLSSCLKSGLSLFQGLEVIVEEMPPPMSQEIGILTKEIKMGIPLEESLRKLEKKMNIEEFTLLVNSLLVARQTGGDLTKVLARLVTTIRDNQKLKESIQTLTLQGRLQGMIMSVLPFLFIVWVAGTNKNHFNIMLQSQLGRMLLMVAAILQIIGIILIKKFSTIKI